MIELWIAVVQLLASFGASLPHLGSCEKGNVSFVFGSGIVFRPLSIQIYCEMINDLLANRKNWPRRGHRPKLTPKDGYSCHAGGGLFRGSLGVEGCKGSKSLAWQQTQGGRFLIFCSLAVDL